MFKVSYFLEVLPIIASKVNITFELTVAATIFALIVGVIIAIIGYYKIPVLYQLTRVYVSIMRGTPVVAQLYFFYYGIALYSAFVRNMTPLIAVAVVHLHLCLGYRISWEPPRLREPERSDILKFMRPLCWCTG